MPNCYYYDEQSNHCNCYVNENLNELLEENVNLRVQLANAMVTVRRVDERCAKLRELLQDYHRYEHEDCYSCRYINECRADESGRCIAPIRLGERYRELGIEVD